MDKLNAEISSIGAIDDATKVAADEIWLFVEEKLKTPVPAYFKNVLSVCGYNNGISIATIVADDLSYIESQVRNGKVGKVFTELKVENFLEGCTMKEKEFEFVRGHKKFLEAIVDFLNGHLKEYGPGSFGLKADLKGKSSKKLVNNVKKREGKILVRQPRKKTFSAQSLVDFAMKTELEIQKYSPSISRDILNEHRRILLSKTLISMHRITETLFKKNLEKIKNKISGNFLSFELESGDDPRALVWCIYCNKSIAVFLRPTENNDFLWKATNFDRHLNLVHREESDNLSCSENEKPPKVDNELDNKKFQETGNSSQLDNNSPKAKSLQETGTEDESVSGNSSKKKDRCEGTGDLVESEDNKTQETKGRVQETGNLSESNNKEPPKTKNRVQGMGDSDYPDSQRPSKKKGRVQGLINLSEVDNGSPTETKKSDQEARKLENYLKSPTLKTETGVLVVDEQLLRPEKTVTACNSQSSDKSGSQAPTSSAIYFGEEKVTRKLHAVNQVNETLLKPGSYVIYSKTLMSSIQWPDDKAIVKNFVGQVRRLQVPGRSKHYNEMEVIVLKNNLYKKFNFRYPEYHETAMVSRKNVLKVLPDPVKNRRGDYVFKDKSLSDYIFE